MNLNRLSVQMPSVSLTTDIGKLPCYAFGDHADFGQAFATVLEAREFLALYDGWLLVTQNASAGLFSA